LYERLVQNVVERRYTDALIPQLIAPAKTPSETWGWSGCSPKRPAGPALGVGRRCGPYDIPDAGGSMCSDKFHHDPQLHPALPVTMAESANGTPRLWMVSWV
jgi:hypothetical protein